MITEKDFINETAVEIKVLGEVFKYKPTTPFDENKHLNDTFYTDEEGILREDLTKRNKIKLERVIAAPITKETIHQRINEDNEWYGLTKEQKFEIIGKTKFFNPLMVKINAIDNPDPIKKKT